MWSSLAKTKRILFFIWNFFEMISTQTCHSSNLTTAAKFIVKRSGSYFFFFFIFLPSLNLVYQKNSPLYLPWSAFFSSSSTSLRHNANKIQYPFFIMVYLERWKEIIFIFTENFISLVWAAFEDSHSSIFFFLNDSFMG